MLDISYLLFAMQLCFFLPVGVPRGFARVTILRESPILKVVGLQSICYCNLPVGVSRGFARETILRESPILKVARALKVFVTVADLFRFMLDISYLLFAMQLCFFLPVGVPRGFARVTILRESPILKVVGLQSICYCNLPVGVSRGFARETFLRESPILKVVGLQSICYCNLPVGVSRGFARVTILRESPILKVVGLQSICYCNLPVGVSRGFARVTIFRGSPILKVAGALKVIVTVVNLFPFYA